MGLDVYVGTLTRYFTLDWETVVQQVAREQDIPVEVLRQSPPTDAVTDPVEVRNGILEWKRGFTEAMREQANAEAEWSESPTEPYFTDKPGFDGHMALCLLAAYSLYPAVSRPERLPDDWTEDRVYRAYMDNEPNTLSTLFKRKLGPPAEGRLFAHVTDLEMWIPGDFIGTVEAGGLAAVPLSVGSTSELLRQLQVLNERTFRADNGTMTSWLMVELDGSFDQEARRGLAIFTELAKKAVDHRLPMKLDY